MKKVAEKFGGCELCVYLYTMSNTQTQVMTYNTISKTATARQLACDIINLTHMSSASQLAALLYGMDMLNTDVEEGYTVAYWAERFEQSMKEKGCTLIGGVRCVPCKGGFEATL